MATNGSEKGEVLIKLNGVQKVFYTEDLETHALADVHMEIKSGE